MVGVAGLGSLPGTDMDAAFRLVFDEPGVLPTFPELPARGPWASITGKGTALLVGLNAEYSASQWRLASHPGIDARRAKATLRDDLDRAEEVAAGYSGPLKVTVPGPWTMAASLFLPLGGRVLGDAGARRDLAYSLAEGVAGYLAEVAMRFSDAQLVLQVDEPALQSVLSGSVPTQGGYFRHSRVADEEAATYLSLLASLAERSVLHSCAPELPIGLVTGSGRDGGGFTGVSLDATLGYDVNEVSAAVEKGKELFWGIADPQGEQTVDDYVRLALPGLLSLELGPVLADRLWLTPTCGLASTRPERVRPMFAALAKAAAVVDERLR